MRVRTLLPASAALLAMTACANGPASEAVRKAQNESSAGPISKWKLSTAPWAPSTQLMRDRAYAFCMARHPKDKECVDWSDVSLIVAHHSESYFAAQRAAPTTEDARGRTLAEHPAIFEDARAHCFAIYDDAGRGDVRMLGPCLSNAVGGDYFGTVPIP